MATSHSIPPPGESVAERVGILLEEYRTLREEAISRTNAGLQLYGQGALFFAAFVTWLFSTNIPYIPSHPGFWIKRTIFFATAGVIGLLTWFFHDQVHKVSHQIARIEKRINGLMGEDLLEWESLHNR